MRIACYRNTSSRITAFRSKFDVRGQASYLLAVFSVDIGKNSIFSLSEDYVSRG